MATARKTKKTATKKPAAKRAYKRKSAPATLITGPTAYGALTMSQALAEANTQAAVDDEPQKHSHYFRDVSHLQKIDVYRITDLFGITDHALVHALKKIMAAGGRGAGKTAEQDVQEAIDSLVRWQEMQVENAMKVS